MAEGKAMYREDKRVLILLEKRFTLMREKSERGKEEVVVVPDAQQIMAAAALAAATAEKRNSRLQQASLLLVKRLALKMRTEQLERIDKQESEATRKDQQTKVCGVRS